MLSFEEYVRLTEAPHRVKSQDVGFNDDVTQLIYDYIKENKKAVTKISSVNKPLYVGLFGDDFSIIKFRRKHYIATLDDVTKSITFINIFVIEKVQNTYTAAQYRVWRNSKDLSTKGIPKNIIFDYLLTQMNVKSDNIQTPEGNRMWRGFIKHCIDNTIKCGVVDGLGKVTPFKSRYDEEFDDAYGEYKEGFRYIIYK